MNVFIDNLKTIANLSALSQFLEKILSSCTKLAKQFGLAGFTLTKGAMKLMSLPFQTSTSRLIFLLIAHLMLNTKSSLKNGWRNILKKKKKWQSLKLNGKLTLTVSLRSLPKLQVITMPPLLGVAPIMPNVVISGWYRRTMNNLVYSLSKYNIH